MRNLLYDVHEYENGTYHIDGAEVAKRLHDKYGVIDEKLYWIDLDDGNDRRRVVAWPQKEGKIITRWDIFDMDDADALDVDRYIFGLQHRNPFNAATAELKDFDPEALAKLSRKSADTDEDYEADPSPIFARVLKLSKTFQCFGCISLRVRKCQNTCRLQKIK